MLTNRAKRKLTAGGLFGLPIALVWITGQMLGGPKTVDAGQTPAIAPAVLTADDGATDAAGQSPISTAATSYILNLRTTEFGPTPLYHAAADGEIVIVVDAEAKPPPTMNVKAIMASKAGNTALIDGAAFRVGQLLGDSGWRIVEIDAVARSVTIREIASERTSTSYVRSRLGG